MALADLARTDLAPGPLELILARGIGAAFVADDVPPARIAETLAAAR